ncbi:hypothetical protein EI94DRAFT_1697228 [Lactarius quietus]|nr:hypothetical protein EI94DRAFT_1697228 [Lactarius quietus]
MTSHSRIQSLWEACISACGAKIPQAIIGLCTLILLHGHIKTVICAVGKEEGGHGREGTKIFIFTTTPTHFLYGSNTTMATGNTLATKAIKANDNFAPSNKADKFHDLVLLHKATLQEFVCAGNRAVIHVLFECNTLLHERISLGGTPIEYNDWDFLTPPSPSLPYVIAPGGKDILFCNMTKPKGLRMPLDRDHVNVGTQTNGLTNLEDADMTLAKIHTEANDTEAEGGRKKRARVD